MAFSDGEIPPSLNHIVERAKEINESEKSRRLYERTGTLYGLDYTIHGIPDKAFSEKQLEEMDIDTKDMPELVLDENYKVRGTNMDFFMRPLGIFSVYSAFVGYRLKDGILVPVDHTDKKVTSYNIEELREVLGMKEKLVSELASVGITDEALTAHRVPNRLRGSIKVTVAGALKVHVLGDYNAPEYDMI